MTTLTLPTDTRSWWDESAVVIEAPEPGAGAWAGGPSAVLSESGFHLAYRLRRPVGQGRGFANVLARSDDGLRFETVGVLDKDTFGAESLERPAIVRTPEGRWRAYVSAATPGSYHWRVDVLESATYEGLATAQPRTVLPGSDLLAVKDPVVLHAGGRWHLWASVHPLEDDASTDRMTTEHATSDDGIAWTWHGTALGPRPGAWDARGVRITAVVLDGARAVAYYDGRATAQENWEERTGLAHGSGPLGRFTQVGSGPALASPHAPHGLRYVSVLDLPDGSRRFYYEATRADGAHELRTHH